MLAPTQPARILLVERDGRAALLIGEMLRSVWGEELVLSQAQRLGEAGRELLARRATCVLLDASGTGAELVEAIEQVRAAASDVPIVVLSDTADDDIALRAIRAGAQDYLVKAELTASQLGRSLKYAIERMRAEVQLAHRALHDSLTGLPNRALFLDRLGVALDRARRTGSAVAVLFLDVDNFKQVNDSLGHAAGDHLLTELAGRLRTMLRPMDTVARFGGDEFTFLFEELTSEREVVLLAERIGRAAGMPIAIGGAEPTVTVSIGIAMVADPSTPPDTVIREADAAMYRAKELGRARYELYDEASRRRALERLELEAALRSALEHSELEVHYQPKISFDGRPGVVGLEALVRWEHPERGWIAPREFIPLAEETGLMLAIGEYVVEQALRQLVRARELNPDVTMSVNISQRQLEDAGLSSMLLAAIEASGVDPAAVWLEVAESTVTRNHDAALRVLLDLKAIGLRIAIDDFGTGSSSVQRLKRLPIDMLKIHESFVAGLGTSPDGGPIVGALVELGHALGLAVVAEGVETDSQLAELRALGCDGAQGFLFGEAMPGDGLDAVLTAG